MSRLSTGAVYFAGSLFVSSSFALTVESTVPVNGAHAVVNNMTLVANFSESVKTETLTSSRFFTVSRQRGYKTGDVDFFSIGAQQAALHSYSYFGAGDLLTAEVTRGVSNAACTASAPFHAWKFHIAPNVNGGSFTEQNNPYVYQMQMPRLADLDGDGDLDCMAAAQNTSGGGYTNTVMINNGSGVFTLAKGIGPLIDNRFVLGDLDRDGDLDVVQLGYNSGSFTNQVWTNNGSAIFAKAYDILNVAPSAGCLDDVNGDGWLDLVLVAQASGAYVLLNDKSGRLVNSGQFLAGTNPYGCVVGDFNGDGFPDFLMGTYGNGVLVFTNDGSGTFGAHGSFGSGICKPLAIGDVNGDNGLDVVVSTGSAIKIYANNAAVFSDSGQTLGAYNSAELADMNGDGSLDIVTPGYLYLNNGSGVFSQSSVHFGGYADTGVDVGDVNNDGYVDVMVSQSPCFGESAVWKNVVPIPQVLGTNGAYITSGTAASAANGTDFGLVPVGSALTHTLVVSNAGPATLTIGSVGTNGSAQFTATGVPSSLAAYSAANITVAFAPTVPGAASVTFTLVNNSASSTTSYPIKLTGNGAVTLSASAGAHGSISPSGQTLVAGGSATNFVVTADPYYWIDSLFTNGVALAAAAHARCYTNVWNSVSAAGTVSATFADAVTARGTPEVWLAQYGWTSDFSLWETSDTDNDGLQAWQEAVAGTVPTNGESVLKVTDFDEQDSGTVLKWDAVAGRVYSVYVSTHLADAADWFLLTNNLPPVGLWTNRIPYSGSQRFYRLGVSKP